MRLPPSWRLVGRARARLIGRARARMCVGLWGRAVLLRGLSVNVAQLWCFGGVRQPHIIERSTRCGSNALDSEALH